MQQEKIAQELAQKVAAQLQSLSIYTPELQAALDTPQFLALHSFSALPSLARVHDPLLNLQKFLAKSYDQMMLFNVKYFQILNRYLLDSDSSRSSPRPYCTSASSTASSTSTTTTRSSTSSGSRPSRSPAASRSHTRPRSQSSPA